MKKNFLAVLLAVILVAALSTVTASAAENEYEVGSAEEWDTVAEEIAQLPEGSEATVILTDDVGHSGESKNGATVMYVGVAGRHVTYKSSSEPTEEGVAGPFFITSCTSMYANGDVTFENVWLNRSQSANRTQGTISSFYGCGHTIEFAENFKSPIANIYGGSTDNVTGNPHLIINGDVTSWNYNGSAAETEVYGGGYYKSTSQKGKVTGNVTIDIREKSSFAWVYGGGYNAGIEGDITINLEAAPNGTAAATNNAGHIVGGGYVSDKGPTNGCDSGTVNGDITLNLHNGKFIGLNGGSVDQLVDMSPA